ncbi:MAG TPA: hypothetical protein VHS06_11025 [Chloroflexota bacterium]|nr:hypothetical protein [Chloroflexota bacterium]
MIDDTVAAILSTKTPAEKVEMVLEANRFARLLLRTTLHSRYPAWTQEQVDREVSRRMLSGAD